MKAVFLGALATSQAAPIIEFVTTGIHTELLDKPDPAALADADIVLTGAWRNGTAGAETAAASGAARRHRPDRNRCAAQGRHPLQRLWPRAGARRICDHDDAGVAPPALRNRDVVSGRLVALEPVIGGPGRGEIGGQTVGIVGLGHIGGEVARRAAALGCHVLAVNRTAREKPPAVERLFPSADLDRMLGECDIVVLSCALTPETTGLIDERRLAAMKPGALLINLARGPIADEDALYGRLRDGVIGGAALDTWWRYPSAEEPDGARRATRSTNCPT